MNKKAQKVLDDFYKQAYKKRMKESKNFLKKFVNKLSSVQEE